MQSDVLGSAGGDDLRRDLPGDGIDSDCDGTDGIILYDDFELGTWDPAVWVDVTGDTSMSTLYHYAGSYSLNLGGGGATATTVVLDTSGCTSIATTTYGSD